MEKRSFHRRKICRFCSEKIPFVEYKDAGLLKNFVTERGKIVPRRISGNCAGHQREISIAIKRARNIALISFSEER